MNLDQSNTVSTNGSDVTISSGKPRLRWGYVFMREYARSLGGSLGVVEDNGGFCLGMSHAVVLRNNQGWITGALHSQTGAPTPIFIGAQESGRASSGLDVSYLNTSTTDELLDVGLDETSFSTEGAPASTSTTTRTTTSSSPIGSSDVLLTMSTEEITETTVSKQQHLVGFAAEELDEEASARSRSNSVTSIQSQNHLLLLPPPSSTSTSTSSSSSPLESTAAELESRAVVVATATPFLDASTDTEDNNSIILHDHQVLSPSSRTENGGGGSSSSSSSSSPSSSSSSSTPSSGSSALPPPRPLLYGETFAGTLDEYDELMTQKKQARDNALANFEAAVVGIAKRRRASGPSTTPPPPTTPSPPPPWFGLNAKQRQSRLMHGVLAEPAHTLTASNATYVSELREVTESRKKSNMGCRCSLLFEEELNPLPIKSLRVECGMRGLATGGTKRLLISRLAIHSQHNLGCTRHATMPNVLFLQKMEKLGPVPTLVDRKRAMKEAKREWKMIHRAEKAAAASAVGNQAARVVMTSTSSSSSSGSSTGDGSGSGAGNVGLPSEADASHSSTSTTSAPTSGASMEATSGASTTSTSTSTSTSTTSSSSSSSDAEETESSSESDSEEEDDDDDDAYPGDTDARLAKAHKSGVLLAAQLAAEDAAAASAASAAAVVAASHVTTASSSATSSSSSVSAGEALQEETGEEALIMSSSPTTTTTEPPFSPSSSSSSSAADAATTHMVHHPFSATIPGTQIPARDICPCAASGEGCHFNRCLCDPALCENRKCGDAGAANYDDIGIFLLRDLIRTLQATMEGELFYPPELMRAARARHLASVAAAQQQQSSSSGEEEEDDDREDEGEEEEGDGSSGNNNSEDVGEGEDEEASFSPSSFARDALQRVLAVVDKATSIFSSGGGGGGEEEEEGEGEGETAGNMREEQQDEGVSSVLEHAVHAHSGMTVPHKRARESE